MQYRKDKYGNELSVLGFGCMRFPRKLGVIDSTATEKLVMQAIAGGVNYFDTAYIYPGSEDALGAVLEKNKVRDNVKIATKLPQQLARNSGDFEKFFKSHLAHLRTNYIDYYLMHMLSDAERWEELLQMGIGAWLREKKRQGAIRQIGFSFHGKRDEFLKILDMGIMKGEGGQNADWDFCQIQYNYSDENYQAGVTGLKAAAAKGIPVIIMEPLLGGRLAGGLPGGAAEIFSSSGLKKSNAEWALDWLFDQSEVTVVLSGMNSARQLEENLTLADKAEPGMLSPAERELYRRATTAFRQAFKIPCTGCSYCMPCPQGVNIPGAFNAYNNSFFHGWVSGEKEYTQSASALGAKTAFASACVRCGKCESHCPQHLPIRDNLALARKRLEPWWYRGIIKIARRFLGK